VPATLPFADRLSRSSARAVLSMLDSAARRRSPATLPGFHAGRAPRNQGMRYHADPRTVEEIVCMMRQAGEDPHGWRLRAMMLASAACTQR
jgi:hypothetical protein